MQREYPENGDLLAERLWFVGMAARRHGQGIMTWSVKDGFRIEVLLDATSVPRKAGASQQGPFTLLVTPVAMRFSEHMVGIVPRVAQPWSAGEEPGRRVTFNPDRMILVEDLDFVPGDGWSGTGLYRLSNSYALPDVLDTKTWIRGVDEPVHRESSVSSIHYEDDSMRLVARMLDREHLEVQWWLSSDNWSSAECWRWGKAIKDSMSILLGETVALLRRSTYFGHKHISEWRKQEPARVLGDLHSPMANKGHLDRGDLIRRATHFVRRRPHADTCGRIFYWIVDAAEAHSIIAGELLVAGLLEVILRTVNREPFQLTGRNWRIWSSLEKFREAYFPVGWEYACRQAFSARLSLRTRNAHADFLDVWESWLSPTTHSQALAETEFLCRFYGYMLLALAGFPDLKPEFPSRLRSPALQNPWLPPGNAKKT